MDQLSSWNFFSFEITYNCLLSLAIWSNLKMVFLRYKFFTRRGVFRFSLNKITQIFRYSILMRNHCYSLCKYIRTVLCPHMRTKCVKKLTFPFFGKRPNPQGRLSRIWIHTCRGINATIGARFPVHVSFLTCENSPRFRENAPTQRGARGRHFTIWFYTCCRINPANGALFLAHYVSNCVNIYYELKIFKKCVPSAEKWSYLFF